MKWNTTTVGIEQRAAMLQHLPIMLDETQQATSQEAIQDVLYAIPDGVGKLRGSLGDEGRKTLSWQLVGMFTGETDILEFTKAAGAAARTISIKGKPFGRAVMGSAEERVCAEEAQACAAGIKQHSGHLGRRVLELLLRADPEKLRAEHKVLWALYAGEASGAGRRLARYLAVLRLAQQVAEAAGVPPIGQEPLRLAWAAAQQSGQAVDIPAAAWEDLQGWVAQEAHRFRWEGATRPGSDPDSSPRVPLGGWAGWVTQDERCVYKHVMTEKLTELGYGKEVNVVLRGWAERGWMTRRADKLTDLRTLRGERMAVYVLKRKHLEGAGPVLADPV